jgi:hypothetical protein
MEFTERVLYHQIHPLKLLTDVSTAFIATALLWNHRLGAWLRSPVAMVAAVAWILGCWLRGLRRD